ncbi:MAG: zinc ABC transporter substrate-binding protein [Archaeoglobaceae archaeon]|nr:zinc ABC transporter substrate-binding protein [Archaeoglobaceae archaeon]MCX8151611.1 zinc ABC transporter substrate-binding protein [Archaeoglobaceae archaeon]MDW8013111.1 zinc ABC transporter substrate-binding protein [Archaeoglobaceae archaeon]
MWKIYTLILMLLIIYNSSAYVVVTIPDVKSLVEKVCECEVYSLSLTDPHTYALTRKDLDVLSKAELIVLVNSEILDFERKIKEKFGNVVDFKDYEVELEDHADYISNPHAYWMKPKNALAIVKAVKDKLSEIHPEKAKKYEENYLAIEKILNLAEEASIKLAGIEGKKFVALDSHVCYIITSLKGEVSLVLFEEAVGVASVKLEELKKEQIDNIVAPVFAKDLAEKIAEKLNVEIIYVEVVTEEDFIVKMLKNAANFRKSEERSESKGADEKMIVYILSFLCLVEAFVIAYLALKR